MKNCGLSKERHGHLVDDITSDAYIWYEENYLHDQYEHYHQRQQLTYVREGYQYFHIENKIYLVPQNHVIWIPSGVKHKTTSDAISVNLMVVLFNEGTTDPFYSEVHVFPAPTLLREMLLYASRWNKVLGPTDKQKAFFAALFSNLPDFCEENTGLQLPVPLDLRLIQICTYIDRNYAQDIQIHTLADMSNMSPRSLQRHFKIETGITVQKYIQLVRVLKSIELIDLQQYTLTEIAFKVGYKSLSAFTTSYLNIIKNRPKRRNARSF